MAERRATVPSLGARLALAFVVVAVAAVAALAGVMLLETRSETGRLSEQERRQTADQVARELARSYRVAGSWSGADATAALALARAADAALTVSDSAGAPVLSDHPGGRGRQAGRGGGAGAAIETMAVAVDGTRVGSLELRFRATLTHAQSVLRDNLAGAVLLGSAIAVGLALLGAALVTPRITGPLRRLAAAVRRLQSGDLGARASDASAPGELGELARAFDGMAEDLDRQERSRRRLVADLAHEVRTPIAILRGNLEELVDGVEEPTPERLASLHEESLRLGALVEQLDALAYAEESLAAMTREPVDLERLAAAQVEALRSQAESKGITVASRLEPVTVLADRARLGQVLANLLANALKFTPEGGRVMVVVSAPGEDARIEVADSGPGIPDGERERVFDRFWRGSAAHGVAGSGIGLAVVADIVRAHGGRVGVTENPEGGALFCVTLPRAGPG